jgi:predicted O-methyltransferase YrrM
LAITEPAIEQYLASLLPERDAVLTEMEQLARENNIPIIGPVVARFLYQIIRLSGARRVFEMGSAIGYSTIWIARAAGPGCMVYYTDSDTANAGWAENFIQRAGVRDRVTILIGNAMDLLDQTPCEFDVIFCDVDKDQYPEAFRHALSRIRKGGLLLADNVLWYGRVTEAPQDDFTRGIVEFNRLIYSSPQLFPSILPVRDGFAVCEKL